MAVHLLECEKEFTPLAQNTRISLKASVYEKGGDPPCNIIHSDQAWCVDLEWAMTGDLIRHFCGTWCVSVVLESVGPGNDYQFPVIPAQVPMDPCGDGTYTYTIDVPAGAVDFNDADGTLYTVAVTLGSKDPCGKPSHIFAYCAGGYLQFVPGPAHTGP